MQLSSSIIKTPIGEMLAVADNHYLYYLRFLEHTKLERDLKCLNATIQEGATAPINMITHELELYFKGQLHVFETPLYFSGSLFQKSVWQALTNIPYAAMQSYAGIAKILHNPTAFRAVALANSVNCFAIVIPCHRVIRSNGDLCGYNGGVVKKQWLLNHEQQWK